jgi:ketosteroid isomerase-like protein
MQEKVDLVRGLYPPGGIDWAAIVDDRATERELLARIQPLLHPEFAMGWRAPSAAGTLRADGGSGAYLTAMRGVMRPFDRFRIVPERFIDLGDRVAVLARLEGRTRKDGLEFTGYGGAIMSFEDGLIRRIEEFDQRDALLEAAGLTAGQAESRGVDATANPA